MSVPDVVAFYLPQFHPIPENDQWRGPGYTEWHDVAGARPRFRGHAQPRLPGELGFYDLRLPETRARQAALARDHGVAAFCYWHYWLGDGRVLLERPLQEVVASGEPDLPFCVAWGNHSWTSGQERDAAGTRLDQRYPGPADDEAHFRWLLPTLSDPRYYRVDGRLLLFLYLPQHIPNLPQMLELWRKRADAEGVGELYVVGRARPDWPVARHLDALQDVQPGPTGIVPRWKRLGPKLLRQPARVPYEAAAAFWHAASASDPRMIPTMVPAWDNIARWKHGGEVVTGATPAAFRTHAEQTLRLARDRGQSFVFLKSWNEWSQGNFVEPDRIDGRGRLEALRVARAAVAADAERSS